MSFTFEILYKSTKSRARVGRIHTPHGVIDTPGFVPVGTNGCMKGLTAHQVADLGVQLMFCNTYHLMVQPGADVVAAAGGLHTFMQRTQPLITDSGGFQVFSLAYGGYTEELKSKGVKQQRNSVAKITEEGVMFRSYRDGSPLLLTPESSIAAQKKLGADIIVSFDELPPYHTDIRQLRKSLDRTHRWEKRSLEAHQADPKNQALYAVVHGGVQKDMRSLSAQYLGSMPFDGYGIGGSVGKDRAEMEEMLRHTVHQLPEDKPVHLLGIGDIPSIELAVPLGIDTFDSSHPTKCARHGLLFTSQGTLRIVRTAYAMTPGPIEVGCPCYTCTNYSVAYVHHLFKAHELTYYTLASIHNISFMMRLMATYRSAILHGLV
ncbi:MAG: queuine tRNA-ribosyltransferase [Candidatus Dependentiae bacterium]|nr:queuine tRNA-ribosyltransferase [Candidatus Dependentiae bacterium]